MSFENQNETHSFRGVISVKIAGAVGKENKIEKDWPAETRKANTNSQNMDTNEINCKEGLSALYLPMENSSLVLLGSLPPPSPAIWSSLRFILTITPLCVIIT